MNDYLLEAREELKRLEHIIFVSLKYTRTVDVIINALKRMVSTSDYIIYAYLTHAHEHQKIESIPKSPALRAKILKDLFPDDPKLQIYLTFYFFCKSTLLAPHEKREEFRRHVTLIVRHEHATTQVNIDNLTNCEKYMGTFLEHAWEALVGKIEQ